MTQGFTKFGRMTGAEKLTYVEQQIGVCMRKASDAIECPYCGLANFETDKSLCCELLGAAVVAIFHRQDVGDDLRRVDRIMEAASRN
jgi:hypothetical protein